MLTCGRCVKSEQLGGNRVCSEHFKFLSSEKKKDNIQNLVKNKVLISTGDIFVKKKQ